MKVSVSPMHGSIFGINGFNGSGMSNCCGWKRKIDWNIVFISSETAKLTKSSSAGKRLGETEEKQNKVK